MPEFFKEDGNWAPVNLHTKNGSYVKPSIYSRSEGVWQPPVVDYMAPFHSNVNIVNDTYQGISGSSGYAFFEAKSTEGAILNLESIPENPNWGGGWQPAFAVLDIDRKDPMKNFKGIFMEANASSVFVYGVDGLYHGPATLIGQVNVSFLDILALKVSLVEGRIELNLITDSTVVIFGAGRPSVPYDLSNYFERDGVLTTHIHPALIFDSHGLVVKAS